jgi:hypothetical protein
MKNYIGNPALAVQENEGDIDGRYAHSVDLITDWGKATAVINISTLKKMLPFVPKVSFNNLKDDLCSAILSCNTKDEIASAVNDILDFGNLMKAICEVNDEIRDDSGNCDADAPYVSDHPVNA